MSPGKYAVLIGVATARQDIGLIEDIEITESSSCDMTTLDDPA